jgi:hypothetical protein
METHCECHAGASEFIEPIGSGFRNRDGVDSSEIVLCCGMRRSGSTLQYQVIAELIERNGLGRRIGFADQQSVSWALQEARATSGFAVIKTHEPWVEFDHAIARGNLRLFYTFRDLRAVALSNMRKWQMPFAEVIASNGLLDEVVSAARRFLSLPGVCVSRYEDIVASLAGEIRKWGNALGLPLTPQETEDLAAEFSPAAQRARIDKLTTLKPGEYDRGSLLHPGHIIDGSVDSWKTALEGWQIREIEDRFGEWLVSNGYALIFAG